MRRPVVIFSLIHAVIFLLIFSPLGANYGAGVLEHFFATKMIGGQVPYIDFATEYSPLALLSFLLPALAFRTLPAYTWAFAIEILLLDLLALALIAALATRLRLLVWPTLVIYTLFVIAVGPIMVSRYDLLPAVLVLAALYALVTGSNKAAWVLLALGIAAKLYPVVIAPFFALYCLHQRQYRRLIVGGITLFGVLLVTVLPWLVLDARSLLSFLSYHAERGLHSESSYGSMLLVSQLLNLTQTSADLTFGSWNLISPLADKLAAASLYIAAGLLLIVYICYGRLLWRKPTAGLKTGTPEPAPTLSIINYSSVAILVFVLTNKVFSPQYLIWLCPLLPLVIRERNYCCWLLFITIGAITQYIYPYHYVDFKMGKPYLVLMLFGRNLLLAIMTILLAVSIPNLPKKSPGPHVEIQA